MGAALLWCDGAAVMLHPPGASQNPGAAFTHSAGSCWQHPLRTSGSSSSWETLELATLIMELFANVWGSGLFAHYGKALWDWEKWEGFVGFQNRCGFKKSRVVTGMACREFWFSAAYFIQCLNPQTTKAWSCKIKHALCGAGIKSQ